MALSRHANAIDEDGAADNSEHTALADVRRRGSVLPPLVQGTSCARPSHRTEADVKGAGYHPQARLHAPLYAGVAQEQKGGQVKAKTAKAPDPAKRKEPRAMADGVPVWCASDALVDPRKLKPAPDNYHRHPDRQKRILRKSIRGNGWQKPVVVDTRTGWIVTGHGETEAAIAEGLKLVPVDYRHYATDEARRQWMIADNATADLAEIDSAALKDLIEANDTGAFDLELMGMPMEEIERLACQFHTPETVDNSEDGSKKGANYFDPSGKTAFFAVGEVASPVEYELLKTAEAALRERSHGYTPDEMRTFMETQLRKFTEAK